MKKLLLALACAIALSVPALAQVCPGPTYAGTTRNYKFTTRQFSDAVPTTGASLAVKAYKGNSTSTEITTGITTTFTSGFDSIAGLVNLNVDYSSDGTFYAAGSDISFILTAGTVGGTSVVGETLCNVHILPAPATADIPDVNVKNINNVAAATPGASGGVLISGSNSGTTTLAALTITGTTTMSDGLVIARSTSNASAFTATGNGTGHGALFTSGSGATGDGLKAISAATNGNGLNGVGTGTGADIKGSGLEQLVSKAVASSFSGTVAANSVIGYLADVSATSSYDRATMSFEGAYTGAPTAANLATVIWQDLLAGSDFSTSSSIGKRIKDNLDVAVSTGSAGAFKTLKKGEAFTNVPIWMLSTTGAAVTGLTTSQISCQISIDGGSWTALTDTTETEIGLGKYVVDLSSGETNGNSISLDCSATGAQHYRTNLTPQR